MTAVEMREKIGKGLVWYLIWWPVNLVMAFLPLLLLNVFQLPSLLIRLVSAEYCRKYNRIVAYMVWGWWAFGIEKVIGVRFSVEGDLPVPGERAIVLSNHQTMADIVVLIWYFHKYHDVSWTNWLAKDILKWIPGLGWGLAFFDTIFLKRDWAKDETNVKATFRKVIDQQMDILLISFAEGTRITPKKLALCQQFAKAHQKPVLHHVLLPRPKGFVAMVQGLEEHVGAIYSTTISYGNRIPTLLEVIRGEWPEVRLHMKRTPMAELPRGTPQQTAVWLEDDFKMRDAWLASQISKSET